MSIASRLALFSGVYCWRNYPHVYAKSINLNRKLTDTYDLALSKYGVLIMPTTITPADPLPKPDDSPITKMSSTIGKLENTCPFNSSGHPALAMPIGFVPAKADPALLVPASMQFLGRYFDELTVLKVAFARENARDWKKF
jgi:amidase